MNLLDAITTLLDATAEMEDRPNIRQARKRLQQRAEALRTKRERAATRTDCHSGIKAGDHGVFYCTKPKGHAGPHGSGCIIWDAEGWEMKS